MKKLATLAIVLGLGVAACDTGEQGEMDDLDVEMQEPATETTPMTTDTMGTTGQDGMGTTGQDGTGTTGQDGLDLDTNTDGTTDGGM